MSAIRRLPRYIWRVLLFLTVGSSTFWITLVPLILAGLCALIWACSEPALRWIGLVLQLAGFVTVAWGIDSRRKVFGLPNLAGSLREWWQRRPRSQQRILLESGEFTFDGFGMTARAATVPRPDSTADERLSILESNYVSLYQEVGKVLEAHETLKRQLQEGIANESHKRTSDVAALETRTRQAVAQGYRVEWAGVVYFFFGIILASGSFELANWLTSFC